jgi:ATP-dependent metalloprotease
MVTKWGFSTKLGIQFIDDADKSSGETQSIVDSEVRLLLSDSYTRAKTLLENNRKQLNRIAEALIEHETLSGSEVADVAKGKTINTRSRSQKASRDPKALPSSKKDAAAAAAASATGNKKAAAAPVVVAKAHSVKEAAGQQSASTSTASNVKPAGATVRGPPTAAGDGK